MFGKFGACGRGLLTSLGPLAITIYHATNGHGSYRSESCGAANGRPLMLLTPSYSRGDATAAASPSFDGWRSNVERFGSGPNELSLCAKNPKIDYNKYAK